MSNVECKKAATPIERGFFCFWKSKIRGLRENCRKSEEDEEMKDEEKKDKKNETRIHELTSINIDEDIIDF